MSIDDWAQRGDFFDYRGHRIFYVREGTGADLLLLHGFPTSSWDWHKIWPELTKSFRVIAFDFIGFGYSDKPKDYPYSLMDQADLTEALTNHLAISDTHILAHDYGDTVAQELLARYNTERLSFIISSTTLLNGGLFPGVHRPRLVQKLLMTPLGPWISKMYSKQKFAKTFNQIFGPNTPPSSQEIDQMWRLMNYNEGKKVFHKLIRYMAERVTHQRRWLTALQECKCPLRLVDGAADPISGKHLVDHYINVIPDPDTVLLHDIGHYPQVESPDQVLQAYFEFVGKHQGDP